MNIFKSLSQGMGRISETNITSFLSYLLSSTNELDNSFLILFFDLIDSQLPHNKISEHLQLNQPSLRQRILHFSRTYEVTSNPEFAVNKNKSKQIIDIVVTISNKKNETDVAVILIENKIKPGASNKPQAAKQYEYFIYREEYKKNNLPVYSVLLTSDFDVFSSMYSEVKRNNPDSVWLRWTNREKKENSMEAQLRQLLLLEQQAEIQPINLNTQFILKSFVDYIVTEFSNSATGERNFSINGSVQVEEITVDVNNKKLILRRYDNKMIRVFDETEELLNTEVLPLLKKINFQYHLQVDTKHPTGTPKNTQVFGKDVIAAFNKSRA